MKRRRLALGGGMVLIALLAAGCTATGQASAGQASAGQASAGQAATGQAATPGRTATTGPGRAAITARTARRAAPTGFWSGTDSWPMTVSGDAPYREPGLGRAYGGYIGMIGSWSDWLGCPGRFLAWSGANSAQADANYERYGDGIGTGVYWFMGGPGVDPSYNGTAAEASAWGARQAQRALADMARAHVTYPVVFMDIELPGIAPAPDNGWDDVYSSPCSGVVRHHGVATALDRADFDGFGTYLAAHSAYKAGVYSDAVTWTQIFGTGPAASIPHTDEWTYEPETADLSDAPCGWCLKSGGCAQFFGGVTSSSTAALMWQWSGGGGVRNSIGDFDQIDASRQG